MQHWLTSSVGRKLVNGLTGAALLGFIVVHLGGNLTLFVGPDLFNSYAHHLESLGPLLWLAEAGLLAFVLFHVVSGASVWLDGFRARPEAYEVDSSKDGPSRKSLASRSMIITGSTLAIFIPLHVWMFKFNGGASHPTAELHGLTVKDLYATVETAFQQPAVVAFYVVVMLLLGLHLRHGFWSAIQTLCALKPACSASIYTMGLAFALLVAGAFVVLPLWFYFVNASATGGFCAGP
ncbi:MAG: succinate dehydrogenase cytochrome b subunit [bacterium]